MRLSRFRAAGLIAGTALALASQAAVAQTTLLLNVFMPRTHHFFTDVFEPWAKQVASATEGRVKIEFSGSSLAPIPRQFDMVQKGIADLTIDQTIFNANRFELVKVAEFPFTSDNTEALSVALWRTYDRHFAKANEYDGVKVLSFVSTGASHFWTSRKPVARLADAQGLKVRMSGVYTRELARALGIAPIAEPGPKAYELVSNGVVDGSVFSVIDIVNFKLSRELPHVTMIPGGLYSAGFALIMNQAKWDALPKADQDALMSVSGEAFARMSGKAWDAANTKAIGDLRQAGLKEARLSEAELAELKKRLAPIEDGWLAAAERKGVDGKAALAYFREQIAAVEKGR